MSSKKHRKSSHHVGLGKGVSRALSGIKAIDSNIFEDTKKAQELGITIEELRSQRLLETRARKLLEAIQNPNQILPEDLQTLHEDLLEGVITELEIEFYQTALEAGKAKDHNFGAAPAKESLGRRPKVKGDREI